MLAPVRLPAWVRMMFMGCLAASATASAQSADESADDTAEASSPSALDDRARAHFVLGRSQYDGGEYAASIEQFEAAFEISGRSALLFNLYQAHHRNGDLAEAIDYLDRYLASDAEVADADRTTLTARLENLRAQKAEEDAAAAARAEAAQAEEARRLAELEREQQDASNPVRTAGWVVLAVGAASTAAFGLFGGLTLAEDKDLAGTCGADMGAYCSDSELGRLQTLTRAADVSLAVGAAGLVTGIVLLLVSRPDADAEEAEQATFRLEPSLSTQRAGLSLRGTF